LVWRIDPDCTGKRRRHGWTTQEAFRVTLIRFVQWFLPGDNRRLPSPIVNRLRREPTDRQMAVACVVPVKKASTKRSSVFNATKPLRKLRPVLQRLATRLIPRLVPDPSGIAPVSGTLRQPEGSIPASTTGTTMPAKPPMPDTPRIRQEYPPMFLPLSSGGFVALQGFQGYPQHRRGFFAAIPNCKDEHAHTFLQCGENSPFRDAFQQHFRVGLTLKGYPFTLQLLSQLLPIVYLPIKRNHSAPVL